MTASSSPKPAPWLNWAAWVALNTTAILVAYALSSPVASAGQFIGLQFSDRLITAVMAFLMGLALSVAQWILVRPYVRRAALWIPATFLGWATPIVLLTAFLPRSQADQQAQIGAMLVSIGVTMGVAQYLVLPRQPHSAWWIPSSALGWIVLAMSLPIPIANDLAILRVGTIPALITGIPFAVFVSAGTPSETQTQTMNAA